MSSDWQQWEAAQWGGAPPAGIEPVPAAGQRELRGRRVIVGLPGVGWRADLRADEPVIQGSRTYVPVVPEQEWYRAETEQIEVFAPLVPIERVWLEQPLRSTVERRPGDLTSRLVSLDVPAARQPVPSLQVAGLTGRRVVHMTEQGEVRDLRAVTEPYSAVDGDICVRITTELEWYRWAWNGQPPSTVAVPVHLLWVE